MCGTQCPGRRTGPRGADHTLSGSANDRTKPQAASLRSGVSPQTRGAAAAGLTVQQSARPGLLLGARVPCLRLLGPPRWLTPTEMRSLTALEVGSPKPGCQQWLLPGTLGERPLPSPFPASDAAGNPGGGRGGEGHSTVPWPAFSRIPCPHVITWPFYKETSHWTWGQYDFILT